MDATEWELRTQELGAMRELVEQVQGVRLQLERINDWLESQSKIGGVLDGLRPPGSR